MTHKDSHPIRLAVVGAGARGFHAYAPYALENPDELQITAVAEPIKTRREAFARHYSLSGGQSFSTWEELFDHHEADAVLVANHDAGHFEPINRAMEKGWHILAEKPLSNKLEEIRALEEKISGYGSVFMICHVLRYTEFFRQLKTLVSSGSIGRLMSIQHNENVGHFHHAHSFVRGNWRRSEESSPMILAKCCHDMDILNWLTDSECRRISSFGSLGHFRPSQAPEGAPERCSDGCPSETSCPYSTSHYFDDDGRYEMSSFAGIVKTSGESEDLETALSRSPYGRCVYQCDNDVVDHQVVNIEYENGCTVSFSMAAFSDRTTRTLKLMGTHGEIRGHMEHNVIEITDFKSGVTRQIDTQAAEGGHNGGDVGLVSAFIDQIRSPDMATVQKANRQGLEGHVMAFAAEASKATGTVQTMHASPKGELGGNKGEPAYLS